MKKRKSGIYKVINLINGKIYIGSSVNLKIRCTYHFSALKKNKHTNKHLQFSFNKYGEECFKFEVIEYCNKINLEEREQYYIDKYKACKRGYNINPNANGSQLGLIRSEKTRKKISLVSKGRIVSEETRRKLSLIGRGKSHSKETRLKLSKLLKNRVITWGDKISKSHKGIPAWNKGIPCSEEQKRKISLTKTGRNLTQDHKNNISLAMRKYFEEKNIVIH